MMVNKISVKGIQLSFLFWCIDVIRVDATKSDISKAVSEEEIDYECLMGITDRNT